jgi:hypothetical protein
MDPRAYTHQLVVNRRFNDGVIVATPTAQRSDGLYYDCRSCNEIGWTLGQSKVSKVRHRKFSTEES